MNADLRSSAQTWLAVFPSGGLHDLIKELLAALDVAEAEYADAESVE